MELINGALYMVKWNGRKDSPETIARYHSNAGAPWLDEDDEPTTYWEFFGDGLNANEAEYTVITRLTTVPVAMDASHARIWADD